MNRVAQIESLRDRHILRKVAGKCNKSVFFNIDGKPIVINSTDGGPGSGNFGHAGRPGEIGGSAKSATALNNEISTASKSGKTSEVKKAVRSAMSSAVTGSSISLKTSSSTLQLTKASSGKWEYEENGKKKEVDTNWVLNSADFGSGNSVTFLEGSTSTTKQQSSSTSASSSTYSAGRNVSIAEKVNEEFANADPESSDFESSLKASLSELPSGSTVELKGLKISTTLEKLSDGTYQEYVNGKTYGKPMSESKAAAHLNMYAQNSIPAAVNAGVSTPYKLTATAPANAASTSSAAASSSGASGSGSSTDFAEISQSLTDNVKTYTEKLGKSGFSNQTDAKMAKEAIAETVSELPAGSYIQTYYNGEAWNKYKVMDDGTFVNEKTGSSLDDEKQMANSLFAADKVEVIAGNDSGETGAETGNISKETKASKKKLQEIAAMSGGSSSKKKMEATMDYLDELPVGSTVYYKGETGKKKYSLTKVNEYTYKSPNDSHSSQSTYSAASKLAKSSFLDVSLNESK